ncbi:hypothetical protein PtA15_14A173 [Puccinia triticina]|uniref:Aspartate carbamoyltransferase n=1 Tax=Puccinia triticina TaxID=208348 RepID=A0ABY7D1K2_9BASI|nr:uncharacterized protein PtA15_14A173 [Puccinia triticina]WAQ91291.1 hypothetical protein PtA15_14A173 [Puccinia triticina]WAR62095.1 hypothetical protein PtB15_14B189 [Puccinia triticina]
MSSRNNQTHRPVATDHSGDVEDGDNRGANAGAEEAAGEVVGSSQNAANVSPVPIINAGEGEHPTQAFLDVHKICCKHAIVLHPLPRNAEIDAEVDLDPLKVAY